MTATEKHEDFLKKLTNLVDDFHKENKDLFIDDIDIVSGDDQDGTKILLGIRVKILVQP
jgi:hypothetical protein